MGKLEGISIQNYGSLRSIKMGRLFSDRSGTPLSNMTTIIGPSGAGKSTVADAFGFIADCLEMGVEAACDAKNRGGYEKIVSQGASAPIRFELYYRETSNSLPQCQVMNSKKPHYSTKKDGSAVQASSILMSYSHLHLRWHKEW